MMLDLIKYGNNMRKLGYESGIQAVKLYDEEFRKLRVVHRLDWVILHDELYRLATAIKHSGNYQQHSQSSGSKNSRSPFLGKTQQKQAKRANSNTNVFTVDKNMLQTSVINDQQVVNLPTPVKLVMLSKYLELYDPELREFLINGFTKGFKLGANGENISFLTCKNHQSALDKPEIVTEKIEKEIKKGRYRGPFNSPPLPNFICSPLGLVPKKEEGQYRVIHDLSFPKGNSVNSSIPAEYTSVSYENIENVIHLVQSQGHKALMARADVENAFRLLPINPEDYHFLGFTWNGKFYYDTCLPMGLSSSCQLFEKFSTALHWILTSSFGISNVSHLLDDFVFVSKASSKACDYALHSFLKLCKTIGVPIKHEKTRFPTTVLTIYGIEIDSNEMIARLPSDKIEKIYDMLVSVKRRRSVTLRDLQSLIGLLNFACSVIIPGRAFLRRLINLTLGHTNPQFRITLNAEARADLRAWFEFIEHFNGKLCFLFDNWVSSDTLRLYSDAAGVHGGFAAVFGNDWFTESAPDCSMVVSKTDNSSSAIFKSVVAKLFTASLSDATHKSYSRMINSYLQFCETYYAECRPFPSSHILLSHFIANLFLRNYSPSTIATHISALSFVHKSNSWPDPTDMFVIHKILKGVQNLKGKNDPRLPITKDILIKLIDSLPCVIVNVDNQLALKAMFLLAFYAFFTSR
ncbi:unnamed protein product [Mytilus edulis]|uniref:Reverse transcriptase domain-containing protein n=1 Tax=Mytilus edulis TaxID=6550 RepID=A0A8S3RUI7_MYTED|nr:unnamed protein product [Mytilus edulis]